VTTTVCQPTDWTWPITHHHINTMRAVLDKARGGDLNPGWRDTLAPPTPPPASRRRARAQAISNRRTPPMRCLTSSTAATPHLMPSPPCTTPWHAPNATTSARGTGPVLPPAANPSTGVQWYTDRLRRWPNQDAAQSHLVALRDTAHRAKFQALPDYWR
jgi:hypothetical protein